MKTKILVLLLCMGISFTGFVHAQGFLNKIKNKANQEVNKLEKGATSTPSSQTQTQAQPSKDKLSANVTRTVLVKLQDGEEFDYGENCIDLASSLDNGSYVVLKRAENGIQCYSYKNGIRKPMDCPQPGEACKEASLPQCSFSELREVDEEEMKKYLTYQTKTLSQPKMSDEAIKMGEAYMTPAEKAEFEKGMKEAAAKGPITYNSSTTINFNGKSYGPFSEISKFLLTPDNKNFYAEVREKAGEYKIITSASPAIITSTLPVSEVFAAPDNSEFAVNQTIVDLKTNELKYVVKTSKGKTYPFSSAVSAWYSPTGNRMVIRSQNSLYVDGVLVKTLNGDRNYEPCDLYITPDGKGVTTISGGHAISFADGDYVEYALRVAIANVGGKFYYRWLDLKNNELAVYQKPY